ncbi:VanW family protein [Salisediminibacterium halotolerans]|uniref:VanW like protein n=1 Tax=Salisediminibacterium halotolerans TaxID=517425 RepID=A0A1H9R442_9BACI|nr:VanW family protein [Salisediminibacterium haloalkalitolerans]SER67478.1 VanW like protein [Salisediminibacterium haloalkalitolerans]
MEKQKWFAGVFGVIASVAVFLTLFTYGGAGLYSYAFGEEQFSEDRQIASADVSEMSVSEAESHVSDEADIWLNEAEISVRWFDERLPLDNNTVSVDEEAAVNEALQSENNNSGIVLHVHEDSLIEDAGRFTGLANFAERVNIEELTESLELELADMPANTQISVNEYMSLENEVLVRSERDRTLEGEASEWIRELEEVTIEADSVFSFHEMLNDHDISYVSGEDAAVLSSAVYETLVQSNFEIVERHIRYERYENVPLGYDAAISNNNQDLQAENVNDTAYTLRFETTSEGFAVELEGYDWPYTVDIDMDSEEQVDYDTRIRFDEQLPPGTEESLQDGRQGEFVRLTRSFSDESNEILREETISEDFYAPQHALEARSTEIMEETSDESEELPDEGSDIPGEEGSQPLPEEDGQPFDTDPGAEPGEPGDTGDTDDTNGTSDNGTFIPGEGTENETYDSGFGDETENGEMTPGSEKPDEWFDPNRQDGDTNISEEDPAGSGSNGFQPRENEAVETDERPLKGR